MPEAELVLPQTHHPPSFPTLGSGIVFIFTREETEAWFSDINCHPCRCSRIVKNKKAFRDCGGQVKGVFYAVSRPPSQPRKQGAGHPAVQFNTHFWISEVRKEAKQRTTAKKKNTTSGCSLMKTAGIPPEQLRETSFSV